MLNSFGEKIKQSTQCFIMYKILKLTLTTETKNIWIIRYREENNSKIIIRHKSTKRLSLPREKVPKVKWKLYLLPLSLLRQTKLWQRKSSVPFLTLAELQISHEWTSHTLTHAFSIVLLTHYTHHCKDRSVCLRVGPSLCTCQPLSIGVLTLPVTDSLRLLATIATASLPRLFFVWNG
jgi:hypothetical protein